MVAIGILVFMLGAYIATWQIEAIIPILTMPGEPAPTVPYLKWPKQVGVLLMLVGILTATFGASLKRKPKAEAHPRHEPMVG